VALSIGILVLLAVITVNMLLLLVSGWLLMYAGIFILGFGGSRWTSDMAINYYKTVLAVVVPIMSRQEPRFALNSIPMSEPESHLTVISLRQSGECRIAHWCQ